MRQEAIERETDQDQLQREQGPRWRLSSTPARIAVLIVAVLILGFVGRGLAADGLSNSFLADLLPWLRGTPVTLYFGAEDGVHLVPVSRTLTGEQDSPEGLVAALLDGPPPSSGLVRLVPDDTVMRSATVDGTALAVDLSAEYAGRDSPLADEALLQTLASWPGVSAVAATVEGVPLDHAETTGHLLYFYDPARDLLIAEPAGGATLRDVLAEYLDGPDGAGLIGLPADVDVVTFHSAAGSGLLELNMTYSPSVREMALDDGDAMRRVLEGLMATLSTGFPNVHFLYLDFEGHATLGLGQCADLLRRVQPPPRVLNDERLMAAAEGLRTWM